MGRLFSDITFLVHLLDLRAWRVLKWCRLSDWPIVLDWWISDDPIGWTQYQISINLKLPNNLKKWQGLFLTPYTYHYNVISKLWIEHFITIYSFSDFELPATISPFNMFYRFQKKKKKRIARYVLYSRLERVDPFFRKLNRNPHGSKLTKQ